MFERDRPVVGVADIARQLDVHKSTASRLSATLAAAGYLEQAGEPGRYRLAAKLAVLGELAARDTELRRAALPHLRDLVQRLGETGHLGVLEGTDAVTVEVVDGWQTVRMHSWVGKRSPAHCSSIGKALLAGLDRAELRACYPDAKLATRTPATIATRAELERCVQSVRAGGHAEDREELEPHLCCVAAPVFDRAGHVAASISVSGPASRFTSGAVPAIAAEVRSAARKISTVLGAPATIPGWRLG
jgi:DNA-binding IclR family transcriptional regulator